MAIVNNVNVDRIKHRAKEYGLTMKFLAQKINKYDGFLSCVRNGTDRIDDNELQVIADILHTTPAYLRGETDEKEKPATESLSDSELDAEFMRLFKQLSPEQQEIIKASIKGILDAKKE